MGPSAIERLLGAPAGDEVEVPLDLMVSDDWTTPALTEPLAALGTERAAVPLVIVHDHTRTPESYRGDDRARVEQLVEVRDDVARRLGAEVIVGRGIQHHVLPSLGRLRPGMHVLGNDSHTPTLGAYGVAAFAGQPTTVAAALHTGRTVLRVPETLRVTLIGRLRRGVSARDAALTVLGALRDEDGVPRRSVGKVLEFGGPGVASLSLAERAVLANVAPEAVAATSLFPVDAATRAALGLGPNVGLGHQGGAAAATGTEPDAARASPALTANGGDVADAAEVVLDLSTVEPVLARGPDPGDVVRVGELARTRVDRVFVGTCAGGTYEEIVAFASALDGPVRVPTQLAPASREVLQRIEQDGVLERLRTAGVELLPTGCGACFGFGVPRLVPGEVAVTTGNRNGRGRMGSPEATIHLGSGRTAGLAATRGWIGAVVSAAAKPSRARPAIVWPDRGNVVHVRGTVTTDDLIPSAVPGIGTSNDDDPTVLRRLLFHHLDPSSAERDLRGTWIVTDHAFGMGSNRASSVRALRAAGIEGAIARSVAPLYAAGARDEGFPVVVLYDDAFHETLAPDAVVSVDLSQGVVAVGRARFQVPRATPYERALAAAGGVVPHLRAVASPA